MSTTANLKKEYAERIAPALKEKFHYTSSMQIRYRIKEGYRQLQAS